MNWSITISGDKSDLKELDRITKILRGTSVPDELESKYSPLQDFLSEKKRKGENRIQLTLEEVQEIIQDDLPSSAYKHDSFWRDRKNNIGAHIIKAGWHVEALQRDQQSGHINKVQLHLCKRKGRDRQ